MKKLLLSAIITFYFFTVQAQVTSFNQSWEFVKDIDTTTTKATLADKSGGSITWEKVTLPHTPQIEPVIKVKEQWQGTCYYRKYFTIDKVERNAYIALQFEAAMHEADVYVNGKQVYKHTGGYLPFTVNISNLVKAGKENCVLVKLNNQDNIHIPPGKAIKDLDFNYYGGIYRNVWLIQKQAIHFSDAVQANHVAGGGIMVHYEDVTANSAKVIVKAEIENTTKASKSKYQVILNLVDKDGKVVSVSKSPLQQISESGYTITEQSMLVNAPKLWSPMHPNLYSLKAQIMINGKVADEQKIKIGIKTFKFEPGAFYLNGEKLSVVGTNRHQEYPYIGYALTDNAQYRDAWRIKQAGQNFVRCSHYPPSPAFLDACDELGILVMDAIPGWQFFGDAIFEEHSYQDIRDMLHRDRNHPSIILWEASLNESRMSKPYMDKAHTIVHTELPYHDVFSTGWIDYAYDVSNPARQHAKAPDYWKKYKKTKPLLLAEYGDWEYYAQNAGFNQKAYEGLKKEERNSRQLRTDGQNRMLQQAYNFQEAHNDNLYGPNFGDAGWLMFDYKRGYAADIESSGMMDIYRLPKFVFYFYQSQYGPQPDDMGFGKPMVFIANYWNDPATKTVKVYSNCDEVELLLNGKSIAKQHPDKDMNSTNLPHPPFTFNIEKFEAGKLEAVAYVNGVKQVQTVRNTPGKPYAIKVDHPENGKAFTEDDILLVHATIVDKNGTPVPDADNVIKFTAKGDISIIGSSTVKCEAGVATILIKRPSSSDFFNLVAASENLREDGFGIHVVR